MQKVVSALKSVLDQEHERPKIVVPDSEGSLPMLAQILKDEGYVPGTPSFTRELMRTVAASVTGGTGSALYARVRSMADASSDSFLSTAVRGFSSSSMLLPLALLAAPLIIKSVSSLYVWVRGLFDDDFEKEEQRKETVRRIDATIASIESIDLDKLGEETPKRARAVRAALATLKEARVKLRYGKG